MNSLQLCQIIQHPDYLTFATVKCLTGKGFMAGMEGYRLDSNISFCVLARLLNVGVSKDDSRVIIKQLFSKDMLVGLERTLP